MADHESLSSAMPEEPAHPTPETMTKLVKRMRVLTLTLLPIEVDPESLADVTSRTITPQVVSAYIDAAGDFLDALPYALLRARRRFMWEANHSPADYGENWGRAIACEVIARRVCHQAPRDRLTYMMSHRYQIIESDGDNSDKESAVEIAIDSHCTIFLSSNEAQDVVNELWKGQLVPKHSGHHDMDYVSYHETEALDFWDHLDAQRMSVPRYQNFFRIAVWLVFLGIYSQAVREPLDRDNPLHQHLDPFEICLYVLALSFAVEDMHKLYKLLHFVSVKAFSFWLIIGLVTDGLFITAFTLRLAGIWSNGTGSGTLRLRSFQVLSYVAPLIWMKLVTVFDGYKYVGTMQICMARMIKESGIFFALLSILGIGFVQGLWALDAADGRSDLPVVNLLIEALLQAPAYDKFAFSPVGLSLYYLWNVATAVILLNVLVSLFSSAYDDVVEDAEAEYLAFFASKTIEMIRAPDHFVYPAPANIIELVVAPWEMVLSEKSYAKLNRAVMMTIFFIPLTIIALYETALQSGRTKNGWANSWLNEGNGSIDDDSSETRDPKLNEDDEGGKQITKVAFDEIVKVFPNTAMSSEATILKEVQELKDQIKKLTELLERR
ncbi:calcium activated cation channel [Punctularia strigosozonata HHB-11173 SS5]|uniref:calcium activated cation channel n=1 Tax=Punctularia strigosozonata (strain HHB-11173) TaxID=741275 RepID=UPI0004417E25|nr:calcium activated cation channel [Punctularia strigosozonata HHB-11173 SS5]EIN10527.1 calcium activated cation channel [Punctularia strigosozonata HHB-11173 SS5]